MLTEELTEDVADDLLISRSVPAGPADLLQEKVLLLVEFDLDRRALVILVVLDHLMRLRLTAVEPLSTCRVSVDRILSPQATAFAGHDPGTEGAPSAGPGRRGLW